MKVFREDSQKKKYIYLREGAKRKIKRKRKKRRKKVTDNHHRMAGTGIINIDK